jgi:hypothetical protein
MIEGMIKQCVFIDGTEYGVWKMGPGLWKVRKYIRQGIVESNWRFIEQVLYADPDIPDPSPMDVVRQAIRVNSWA